MKTMAQLGRRPERALISAVPDRVRKPSRQVMLLVALVASLLHASPPALAAPPANDDFNAATVIGALPFSGFQDTFEATPAVDDPNCSFGSEATVWYAFTPAENQRLTANTFGSDFDTVLSAYTGSRGALNRVACNDDAGNGFQSRIAFDATAGTTYYFMIGSFDFGGQLSFALERARVATNLRLTTSKNRVFKGESVRVTAHLDAFAQATNKDVSIFAIPSGGTKRLVETGAIDASGDFAVTRTLGKTTAFVAEWAGDENFLPATSKRKTVYFGVKNGLWFGTTRQGFPVEFRVKNGVKIVLLRVSYRVRWRNCNGNAFVELNFRFKRPIVLRSNKLRIEWNIRPIKGLLKGTFRSRSRITGRLSSTINDRAIGCSGSLDGLRWNANRF